MTGLDPGRHVIVEIATLITDDELNIVAEGPDLVVATPATALAEMDSFVRTMHTSSGLLAEIDASTLSLADAGAATLEFHPSARAQTPHCAFGRQFDRYRPSFPGGPTTGYRGVPALPFDRRVHHQGTVHSLVPGRTGCRTDEGRWTSSNGRHQRERG